MANVDEARQANMGDSANNNKQSDWQKQLDLLSTMALAKGADTGTMAGFALGKWLSNYFSRGQSKKDNAIAAGLDGNANTGLSTDNGRNENADISSNAITDNPASLNNANKQYDFASALNALGQQANSNMLGNTPGAIGFNTTTNKLEYVPLTTGLMANLSGMNINGGK